MSQLTNVTTKKLQFKRRKLVHGRNINLHCVKREGKTNCFLFEQADGVTVRRKGGRLWQG